MKRITISIFIAALVVAAFYAALISARLRSIPRDPLTLTKDLQTPEHIGPVVYERADVDGDGVSELIEGYAVVSSGELGNTRPLPRLRVFRGDALLGEFAFSIDARYTNADEWRLVHGVPSFERKDFEGDGAYELLVQLDAASNDYHALGMLAWRDGALGWLPLTDESGGARVPLFRDGGTDKESWRLFFSDVDSAPGLEIVTGHGFLDEGRKLVRWEYEVYVRVEDGYRHDPEVSRAVTQTLGGVELEIEVDAGVTF